MLTAFTTITAALAIWALCLVARDIYRAWPRLVRILKGDE
jgi:hypothetical protein